MMDEYSRGCIDGFKEAEYKAMEVLGEILHLTNPSRVFQPGERDEAFLEATDKLVKIADISNKAIIDFGEDFVREE